MPADDDDLPRERRPTIRDVAAEAGVSKSVASRVYSGSPHVSEQSRTLVLEAAERLGFRPNWVARSLAGDRDDFVGILVADLHNPVFAEVVDAVRAELSRFGQVGLLTSALLPSEPSGSPSVPDARWDDHALALFGDLRPSRLLIVGTVPNPERVLEASSSARVVVASAVAVGLPSAQVVRGDDDAGLRLVIDHLVALGHRRIVHIGGAGGPVAMLREAAFRRTMGERGLGSFARVEEGDYSQEAGYAAARVLLAGDDPPTAIVAVNDLSGLGALVAADEFSRRTGTRIAVTGYDNTFLAALPQIALTSVDPGNARIGREAARLLLADDAPAAEVLIPPTLVERASTLDRG